LNFLRKAEGTLQLALEFVGAEPEPGGKEEREISWLVVDRELNNKSTHIRYSTELPSFYLLVSTTQFYGGVIAK